MPLGLSDASAVIAFIERCSSGFVIDIDVGGAPHVGCVSGVPAFAVVIDHDTLALRLPAGEVGPHTVRGDRVALLMIDTDNRRYLLLRGRWDELPGASLAAGVRRRVGIPGRGRHDEFVGILDIEEFRWCETGSTPATPGARRPAL